MVWWFFSFSFRYLRKINWICLLNLKASSASISTKLKKGSFARVGDSRSHRNSSLVPPIVKPATAISHKNTSSLRNDGPTSTAPPPHGHLSTSASLPSNEGTTFIPPPLVPCSMTLSPERSDGDSISLDETMSTCHSMKSPDIEYIDNVDASAVGSLERRTSNKLYISEHAAAESQGNTLHDSSSVIIINCFICWWIILS